MIIKSLELNNFRQYKGYNKIIFSTDKYKNVTIIKGENGAGKTTLLEAFMWCFYGNLTLPNPEKLLTTDIVNSMKESQIERVSVEVNFIHNSNEYYIRRSIDFQKNMLGQINRTISDSVLQIKSDDGLLKELKVNELNKIIPHDLSTYFFFDGERIENISKSNRAGKRDLNLAIRNILGLDVVSNAQKHLRKVKVELEKDYSSNSDSETKEIQNELTSKRNNFESTKDDLYQYKLELNEMEEELERISGQLKSYDELKQLEQKRIELDGKKTHLESDIEKIESSIKQINKRGLPEYLVNKLLALCKDKVDLSKMDNRGIIGVDGAAIDYIINRGRCICGQEVKAGNIFFDNLIKQKEYQPPASLGVIINQFAEKTSDINKVSKEYKDEINDIYKELEYKKYDKENIIEELEELSRRLIKSDKAESLENKRKELITDKIKCEFKIDSLENDIKILKNDIENLEGKLQSMALQDEANKLIGKRLKYVEILTKEVDEFYEKRYAAIKEALNEKISEIFSQLLCTNHSIVISEDYSFIVKDIDGEESTSQGQDIITSFAFIAAIIGLAREKHKEIEVNEPYPLIMDAPFAKLSKSHRANVSKLLPSITEQFILITVDSQYEGEVEEKLGDRIGKQYELVMHMDNEKYTEIVERS